MRVFTVTLKAPDAPPFKVEANFLTRTDADFEFWTMRQPVPCKRVPIDLVAEIAVART